MIKAAKLMAVPAKVSTRYLRLVGGLTKAVKDGLVECPHVHKAILQGCRGLNDVLIICVNCGKSFRSRGGL